MGFFMEANQLVALGDQRRVAVGSFGIPATSSALQLQYKDQKPQAPIFRFRIQSLLNPPASDESLKL